jgi:hypothetical protein
MIRFGPGVSELRQRKRIRELPIRQPVLNVDRIAVHFRNRRIAAADGE